MDTNSGMIGLWSRFSVHRITAEVREWRAFVRVNCSPHGAEFDNYGACMR